MQAPVTVLTAERIGRGPRLALVHGFTQTGRSWRHLAAHWSASHEVIAVDAPGHGASAEVVLDLVDGGDALAGTIGRGTYVGYSMGGRLVLHAALQHPRLIERLVLLGATPGIADDAERTARRASDEALASDLERDGLDAFLRRWLANPLFASLPAEAADPEDRRRNTVAGLASSLRLAGTGTQAPLWGRLPELQMPVLVLAGELDGRFRAIGEEMAAAIGVNASFAIVPGAGHCAHLEQPDRFVRLVDDFLQVDWPTPR